MRVTNEFEDEHPSNDFGTTVGRRLLGLYKRIYVLEKAADILLDEFNKIRKMHVAIGDNLKVAYDDPLKEISTMCKELGETVDFLRESAARIEKCKRENQLRLVRPEEK